MIDFVDGETLYNRKTKQPVICKSLKPWDIKRLEDKQYVQEYCRTETVTEYDGNSRTPLGIEVALVKKSDLMLLPELVSESLKELLS